MKILTFFTAGMVVGLWVSVMILSNRISIVESSIQSHATEFQSEKSDSNQSQPCVGLGRDPDGFFEKRYGAKVVQSMETYYSNQMKLAPKDRDDWSK